jgi:outer membrane immunogenic protein
MRRLAIALVATAAFTQLASAADLPAKAYTKAPVMVADYNWTGWYAGLNAGGAWGKSDVVTRADGVGTYFAGTSVTSIAANGNDSVRPNGFTGGVQAGYNWQTGNLVTGLEADFNYFGTKASRSVTVTYPCCAPTSYTINQEVKTDWLFTARPRLGFTNNNWLWYATAGVAITNLKYNNSFTDTFAAAIENGSVSKTKVGWTAGAGAEYALLNSWSVKAEYLYVDFGSVSSTGTLTTVPPGSTAPFSHSAILKSHIVRFGINKKI